MDESKKTQQQRYVETHREQVNEYARAYYKRHPERWATLRRERSLKKRELAVKTFITKEFEEHRESVLSLLKDEKVMKIKVRQIRYAVFGALLYVLIDKNAIPYRQARSQLPYEAKSEGYRPYISTLRTYKKIRKVMRE